MKAPAAAQTFDARSLALNVLLECHKKEAFVQELLDRRLRATALAPAERRLATQLVYGVLRRRGTLDALLRPKVSRPAHQVEPWLWETLRLGAFQIFLLTHIPPHAAVNETVALASIQNAPRAKGFINAVLRALLPLVTAAQARAPAANALPMAEGLYRVLAEPVLPDPAVSSVEYLADAFSLPAWLAARWHERHGWEECLRLGFWFAGPAPLYLRANTLRGDRGRFMQTLGDLAEPGSHPLAVRLRSYLPVREIPGYDEGRFVVQDESAMRVADALAPEPGMRVLDLCAAPGGKTTHLAQLMHNQGSIVACDIEARKLEPLQETVRRLGINIVETRGVALSKNEEPPPGPFDAVLVDAPCSNTGVLGKRPEVRWRLKPADLGHLVKLQTTLLLQAGARVRPGGKVVYSTCSIEPEENQHVVRAVLERNPTLLLEDEEEATPGRPADGGYWARLRRRSET